MFGEPGFMISDFLLQNLLLVSNFWFPVAEFLISDFLWPSEISDFRYPAFDFASPDSKFSGQGNPASSFLIPIPRDVFAENLVNTVVFACFSQKSL